MVTRKRIGVLAALVVLAAGGVAGAWAIQSEEDDGATRTSPFSFPVTFTTPTGPLTFTSQEQMDEELGPANTYTVEGTIP